jgi:hypothetical protein
MKKLIFPAVLLISAMITSCNTTKKLYEAKEYDQIIMKEAPKVCSGHIQPKKINLIAAAYHEANQADHERIQALKATGSPDVWPEIFERYCSMKGRNDALSCFPNEVKKGINYTKLNLDDELQMARNKAEAYLTAAINQHLSSSNPNLDQADKMIRQLEGINKENSHLNGLKVKSMAKRYGDISRLMHVEVFKKLVGPNRDETASFKETNGNLTATVTDHKLSKNATIKGKVNFIDPSSKRMLFSMPYEVSSQFEHNYSTLEGPREACSEQTLERLKQHAIPFPTDESLVNDAKQNLINLIYQMIQ